MPNSNARAVPGLIEDAFQNADEIPLAQRKLEMDPTLADLTAPGTYLSSGMGFRYEHNLSGSMPGTHATGSNAEFVTETVFTDIKSKLDLITHAENIREYVEAQAAARVYESSGVGWLRVARAEMFEDVEAGLHFLTLDWEAGGFS